MSVDSEVIEQFFLAVLSGNVNAMRAIDRSGEDSRLVDGTYVFTLSALQSIVDPDMKMHPAQFRKILYGSDLAARLSARGGEIGVWENYGKVAENHYYLRATRAS